MKPVKPSKASKVLWVAVYAACAVCAVLLAGCLLDHPLITPGNAYDPKVALSRDSLSRFDSVEILLVDPEDPSVSIRLWKGPLTSTDGLPPHLAGDGQTLVYIVQGYRAGRGHCYTEQVSQAGVASVLMDSCAILSGPKPLPIPRFHDGSLDFGANDTAMTLGIERIEGSGDSDFEVKASVPWLAAQPAVFRSDTSREILVTLKREGLTAGPHQGALILMSGSKSLDTLLVSATVPEPKPLPVPKFHLDSLDFGMNDTVITLQIDSIAGSGDSSFRLLPSSSWIRPQPDSFKADKNTAISVVLDRAGLATGDYHGALVLMGLHDTLDTVFISAKVPKPVAQLNGTLVSWKDSSAQSGFTVVLDGAQPGVVTDGKGSFAFPGMDLGPHVLSVMQSGRVGKVDTFTVTAKGGFSRTVAVAPAGDFKILNVGWSHHAGHATVAGGYGLLPSSDFGQEGSVLSFPLDNPSPSLQKFFPQGNSDGDPDFPEYFEAGEIAADSKNLFLTYPDASRLGRIGDWKTTRQTQSVAIPFQPGGLLLEGTHLLALGRLADSTLVFGDFNASDLSLNRIDTLKGFYWDGVLMDQRCPKLAAWGDAYFAVDGNSPNTKGHLLRIDRSLRRVTGSKEIPDASINDLAIHDGMIYVTSMSSSEKSIRIFDPALSETGSIVAGVNTNRIAFATEGKLSGYGFVTTEDNAVLVIHPLSKKPMGQLNLPGNLPGRSISVDGVSGKVLVSDGDKLYINGF